LFYFVAYDQQLYSEIKQKTRPASPEFSQLKTYLATAFGGALAQDFGPIQRTNDAQVGLVKLDWRINETHNASLKYNYTNSKQQNGTFDVDTWARSANAVEKDFSNAVNGSLVSHLTNTIDNEFRLQLAREDRPRSVLWADHSGTEPAVLRYRHGLRQRVQVRRAVFHPCEIVRYAHPGPRQHLVGAGKSSIQDRVRV